MGAILIPVLINVAIAAVALFAWWLWLRHKDRQHARDCVRRFDAFVRRLYGDSWGDG